jgi:hypothetical protein
LLNPKPPDPEAAFAFQAIALRPRTPRNARKIERLPAQEADMSISRSIQAPARASAAAFDFDVVSDAPARPSRKPDPAPETAPPERGLERETAKPAEA